jgi:predicted nuclease with RNAse H fold
VSDGLWAGVDVGAAKGFDVAALDDRGLAAGPQRLRTPDAVVAWLSALRPRLVAVDSPHHPAPDGARSRADERALAATVCGIRYTPDAAALRANRRYYAWVAHGLTLYDALERGGLLAVECFPTATWTRLGGPRDRQPRGAWSDTVLRRQPDLDGLPRRLSQDARDAIGAALTARLHNAGATERYGEIVVPRSASSSARPRAESR